MAKIRGVLKRFSGSSSLLLLATWFVNVSAAPAASVQLAWDKNPENNIAAYEVSYGTAPGIYPNTLDAGNNTSVIVPNLETGITYYFVVVARNKAGLIGPKSASVSHTINNRVIEPPNGTIITPADTITINAGERVAFEGNAKDPLNNEGLVYRWNFGAGAGISDADARTPGLRKFTRPGTYEVTFTVTNALGATDPTPAVRTIIVKTPAAALVSHKNWKLKYVDSQEATGYAAANAFDGNTATFWHTQFTNTALINEPHEMQIDMRKALSINGFQYVPRQDGFKVGNVAKFQFFVSMDGKNWGKPVVSGTFENSTLEKQVFFTPKRGRYIRLRSLSEANGFTDTNVAELSVFKTVKTKNAASAPAPSTSSGSNASAPAHLQSPTSAAPSTPALSSSPLSAPHALTTEIIDGRKYLSITVTKPTIPDGITRTIQVSPNLLDWFSGDQHTTVLIDNASTLKIRDNTPVSLGNKRFIRLKSTPR